MLPVADISLLALTSGFMPAVDHFAIYKPRCPNDRNKRHVKRCNFALTTIYTAKRSFFVSEVVAFREGGYKNNGISSFCLKNPSFHDPRPHANSTRLVEIRGEL